MVRYQRSDLTWTVVDVFVAEFRESITHAIPKIVAFLSLPELNVRKAGADALSKLSGQGNVLSFSDPDIVDVITIIAEFRESIRDAIPELITLLRPWSWDVCEAAANALVKLSEQGQASNFLTWTHIVDVLVAEFRESFKPAIPQIIALLSDKEWIVRRAGADTLSRLSEQGKISFPL